MITLRQLRYFEALSETLHFGRAAKRLNISQPALSAQIAQMEAFFGGALFQRSSGGIALTGEGAAIGARVRSILTEVRELESIATAGDAPLSRRLRLGVIASVAPYLLPSLLALLADEHPRLECEVRESVTDRLLRELSAGEIDCAVVALPVDEHGLETLTLFEDRFHFAVPADQADRYASRVPIGLMRDVRLILLEEGHCLRDQALEICQIADASERAGLGATSLSTILRMVAAGLGATLIPDMAVGDETRRGGIAILPFEEPAPARTIALAFRPSTARRQDFEVLADVIRRAGKPERDLAA
jgi:LysR family hydrogen peroxide-inducible transcriptional activator